MSPYHPFPNSFWHEYRHFLPKPPQPPNQPFAFHHRGGELQLLSQVHHRLVFAEAAFCQKQATCFFNTKFELNGFAGAKAEAAIVVVLTVEVTVEAGA